MTEQFEQAKIEFAEKHKRTWHQPDGNVFEKANNLNELLSDLNALLEQHKEVILADTCPKEFIEWIGSEELYCDKGEWLCPVMDSVYGEIIRKTTAELFDYWLKNVKK